jgi:hypothetical protein
VASDYSYIPLIKSWDFSVSHLHTTPIESYYHIEANQVSLVHPVEINCPDNLFRAGFTTNVPIPTLVLEGKIFDKIEKIVKFPRGHVYDEWQADISRNHLHRHSLIPSVLLTKIEDTRNLLKFHLKCLAEIRKLFQYPTSQNLPDLYWRPYFMDDKSELSLEMRELFEEYMHNMEVEIGVLEDLIHWLQSNTIDRYNLVPAFTPILTWNLSKILWKCTFLPWPLIHLCRFLLCISVTHLTGSLLKNLRNRYVLRRILYYSSHSVRFLNEHNEIFMKAENKLSGRNFWVTESGHVAWISLYAKKGDGICVFRGCRFQFAVRKSGPHDNGKYKLRGDCYMHGLMGENLFEKARIDVETIKLI